LLKKILSLRSVSQNPRFARLSGTPRLASPESERAAQKRKRSEKPSGICFAYIYQQWNPETKEKPKITQQSYQELVASKGKEAALLNFGITRSILYSSDTDQITSVLASLLSSHAPDFFGISLNFKISFPHLIGVDTSVHEIDGVACHVYRDSHLLEAFGVGQIYIPVKKSLWVYEEKKDGSFTRQETDNALQRTFSERVADIIEDYATIDLKEPCAALYLYTYNSQADNYARTSKTT
jgi:hypothetical protein